MTTQTASVLIFSNCDEIKNKNPRKRQFEFLGSAQIYAEMLSTSNSFLLIQVIDHNGELYCEYEN